MVSVQSLVYRGRKKLSLENRIQRWCVTCLLTRTTLDETKRLSFDISHDSYKSLSCDYKNLTAESDTRTFSLMLNCAIFYHCIAISARHTSFYCFDPHFSGGGRNYILNWFFCSVNFGRSIYSLSCNNQVRSET